MSGDIFHKNYFHFRKQSNISQNTFFRILRLEIIKLELVLVGRSHADGHHVDVEKEETHNETLPQTDEDELDNQERITMVGEIAKKDQSDHEEDALDEDEHGDYLRLDGVDCVDDQGGEEKD